MEGLDLEGIVFGALEEVFDTMLSMEVERVQEDFDVCSEGLCFAGSVSFAGENNGSLNVHLKEDFARVITAAMLGMDTEEIEGEEEVMDVIGELSNMIGGNVKSRFNDFGYPCELSIPSVTKGEDFEVRTKNWNRHEGFGFRYQEHKALVEVYLGG